MSMRLVWTIATGLALAGTAGAHAQARVVAYVPSTDATATGVLELSSGRNVLGGSSVVTAGPRPARVTLVRGGQVEVCQGSTMHLSSAQAGDKNDPLLIGLDRGAMEIKLQMTAADAVLTPDLRFTSAEPKGRPLDLAMRVTSNGDTCVENRGRKAPMLNITDAFGEAAYQLKPGQHVLFEHGSLREVVDRETTPCGCPSDEGMSLADAALHRGKTGTQAGEAHPFPAAVSEGLAEPAPLPPEQPGQTHVQSSAVLSANPGQDSEPPTPTPAAAAPVTASTIAPAPPPSQKPESKPGVLQSVGHFFHKLFVR